MSQKNRKAFVSWSGGKDSALAYYNAVKSGEIEIACLLNMLAEDGTHSRSHHLSVAALRAQAEAMGIALAQRQATWPAYETEFKTALACFQQEGIHAGIFGDIDVQEHRDWVERVCRESGLAAMLPLWQRARAALMEEFIACGFRAVIVAVNLEYMGDEWLGRQLDRQFVADMRRIPQVDLCGENGEYHTFVYDGPMFKKPVEFVSGGKMQKDKCWFLDLELS